jgi:glutamine synthetase
MASGEGANPFSDCRTAEEAAEAVRAAGVEGVQLGIFDIDAILRWKWVPAEKFIKLLRAGYPFCDVLYAWDVAETPYSSEAYADAPCTIDPASGRPAPFAENEALFIADFDPPTGLKSPRHLLARQLEKAAGLGIQVTAGFEYEFFVFEETPKSLREKRYRDLDSWLPGNRTYSAMTPVASDGFFAGLREAVGRAGIRLDSQHTELGPGCFEFPLKPAVGMAAADEAALYRHFVRAYCHGRGLMPSFMAKWSNEFPGQSGHLHVSLQDAASGEPLFHDPSAPDGVSQDLRWFVGGLLRVLPEALALCSHTVNAFRRLVPGAWAPTSATWGIQNRTTAARVILGDPSSQRLEFRVPAADANPHMALSLLLGAGFWGLENRVEPPAPVEGDAYANAEARAAALPRTLLEAAEALERSTLAREIFGADFVEHFAATRKWEDEVFRRTVSELDLRRYLETF